VLVRDVAYGQIPRAARSEKHRRAAEWIESLGRADDHAEMIGHHLTTALDYAAAAGIDTTQLELDARRALRRAGDRAAGLGSLPAAAAWYERLLELTPESDAGRPQILYRYIRTRIEEHDIDDALLGETVSGLLASGDTATAAEAEAAFANIYWLRGDRNACFASVARAVELVADEEASPAKAYVLAQASRFEMLAGHDERAIELGRAALELGERFGLEDVCSRALDNIGCSRVNLGDVGGIGDLERSLAIGEAANSVEAWQAAGNLASMFFQLGFLDEAEQMVSRRNAINERFGIEGLSLWERAEDVELCYVRGRWDEAERLSVEWLAEVEASAYYMEAPVRQYRSRLLLACDNVDGAVAEAELMLERARGIQDPQILQPALAWWAGLALAIGRREDAADAVDQMLTSWGATYAGHAFGALDLAWAARALRRESEVECRLIRRAETNRWLRAALHVVRGELPAAVSVVTEIGSRPDLAHAQLRAAEAFVHTGRRAEADEQLARALAFYRSVGATRYIREGEALLAAAS
jgi:tetratricopeptide (TPR) repeat protein